MLSRRTESILQKILHSLYHSVCLKTHKTNEWNILLSSTGSSTFTLLQSICTPFLLPPGTDTVVDDLHWVFIVVVSADVVDAVVPWYYIDKKNICFNERYLNDNHQEQHLLGGTFISNFKIIKMKKCIIFHINWLYC